MKITALWPTAMWLAALLLACSTVWAGEQAEWVPAKIEHIKKQVTKDFAIHTGSVVTFKNGTVMKADINELAYVGLLKSGSKTPVLIFSGRPCDECDANTSLYFHSPDSGKLQRDADHYGYPGKLNYYEDNSLVQVSRLFLGKCLPLTGEIAIWYDSYKDDAGKWINSVYVLEVRGGKLHGDFLKPPLPGISKSLGLVKSGGCREVPGRDMTSEP